LNIVALYTFSRPILHILHKMTLAACVICEFSSFVKLYVKQINCDGSSKSLIAVLSFRISQGSVATQLRWRGNHGHLIYLWYADFSKNLIKYLSPTARFIGRCGGHLLIVQNISSRYRVLSDKNQKRPI